MVALFLFARPVTPLGTAPPARVRELAGHIQGPEDAVGVLKEERNTMVLPQTLYHTKAPRYNGFALQVTSYVLLAALPIFT